jgi:hypothetical protein
MNKNIIYTHTMGNTILCVPLYCGGFVIEMEILKENYRMNMSTKFGSNLSSGIREDDWNVKAYGRR